MKATWIALLAMAQIAAQPAAAASIEDASVGARAGTFAGVRLRVATGSTEAGRPRLGLAISGMRHDQLVGGAIRRQFSEGVELGFNGGDSLRLSLAGQPIRPTRASFDDDGKKGGISTLGYIGIAAGVLLVAGAIGFAVLVHEIEKNSD